MYPMGYSMGMNNTTPITRGSKVQWSSGNGTVIRVHLDNGKPIAEVALRATTVHQPERAWVPVSELTHA